MEFFPGRTPFAASRRIRVCLGRGDVGSLRLALLSHLADWKGRVEVGVVLGRGGKVDQCVVMLMAMVMLERLVGGRRVVRRQKGVLSILGHAIVMEAMRNFDV